MSIAKALASDCKGAWGAEVLCCTGLWLSESRLESPEVIQKDYFEAAVALDSGAQRQFADFLDQRLAEEISHQGSAGHARTIRTRKLTETNVRKTQLELEEAQRKGAQQKVREPGLDYRLLCMLSSREHTLYRVCAV